MMALFNGTSSELLSSLAAQPIETIHPCHTASMKKKRAQRIFHLILNLLFPLTQPTERHKWEEK